MIGAGTESRWRRWRVTLSTRWGTSLTRRTTSRTSHPRAWPSGRPRTRGRLSSNLTQSTQVTWTCRPPRRRRSSLNHCDLPSLVLRLTEQECFVWVPILSFKLTEIITVLFIYRLVRCEMWDGFDANKTSESRSFVSCAVEQYSVLETEVLLNHKLYQLQLCF